MENGDYDIRKVENDTHFHQLKIKSNFVSRGHRKLSYMACFMCALQRSYEWTFADSKFFKNDIAFVYPQTLGLLGIVLKFLGLFSDLTKMCAPR